MICAAVEVLLVPKFPSMGESCTAKLFYKALVKSGLFACLKNGVGSVLHWKHLQNERSETSHFHKMRQLENFKLQH